MNAFTNMLHKRELKATVNDCVLTQNWQWYSNFYLKSCDVTNKLRICIILLFRYTLWKCKNYYLIYKYWLTFQTDLIFSNNISGRVLVFTQYFCDIYRYSEMNYAYYKHCNVLLCFMLIWLLMYVLRNVESKIVSWSTHHVNINF